MDIQDGSYELISAWQSSLPLQKEVMHYYDLSEKKLFECSVFTVDENDLVTDLTEKSYTLAGTLVLSAVLLLKKTM